MTLEDVQFCKEFKIPVRQAFALDCPRFYIVDFRLSDHGIVFIEALDYETGYTFNGDSSDFVICSVRLFHNYVFQPLLRRYAN